MPQPQEWRSSNAANKKIVLPKLAILQHQCTCTPNSFPSSEDGLPAAIGSEFRRKIVTTNFFRSVITRWIGTPRKPYNRSTNNDRLDPGIVMK
uniref:Uncharacterized protein n=1 Tax=Steinernema glaseri TaxID=37863 RepID=A0A1I7Z3E8_9BILA